MAPLPGSCDWAWTVTAEDSGDFFELHVALGAGVTWTDVEASLSGRAVRLQWSGAASAYELTLPAEVASESATVQWHKRSRELRFALPWLAQEAGEGTPRLATAGPETPDHVAGSLSSARFHVVDGFLGEDFGRLVAKKVTGWYESGRLAAGVVGTQAKPLAPLAKVRGDVVAHLQENEDADVAVLLRKFDSLAVALAARSQSLRRVTQRSHAMVAVYPPKSCGYIRHVDNPGRDPADRRRLTFIYYLNFDWRPRQGGALRLHLKDGPLDVVPTGDRFVCFLADDVEHEVLPAWEAPRAAISVWYSEAADARGQEPERPLPVQAVRMMAAQLARCGAVRLPDWMRSAVSAEELSKAAQALAPMCLEGGEARTVLGEGDGALHAALVALSDRGADCFIAASAAVANCVACAERLLSMLRRSSAPGWEPGGGSAPGPRRVLLARHAPGAGASFATEAGSTLGCVVGLSSSAGGLTATVSASEASHRESLPVNAGDVLLLHPSHMGPSSWQAAGSSVPALTVEVWF